MRTSSFALFTGCVLAMAGSSSAPGQTPDNPPPDQRFKADILVIAPHPDDESTIAGYLAKAVLDEHRRVAVVFTTRGDAG
ncbi:MAG TPA: PIG-L family deacetylase, partial [Gemmatimonadaceae bacterium]|nr:PIG-L family deacetylase [Gemmatimonadaceae bacterium]